MSFDVHHLEYGLRLRVIYDLLFMNDHMSPYTYYEVPSPSSNLPISSDSLRIPCPVTSFETPIDTQPHGV